ncbi:MAG: hypothetical protein M3P26_04225 [Gemmatimonadota bacterium]|nr:hypothetical protein [Gemmatimonadota bacterium]
MPIAPTVCTDDLQPRESSGFVSISMINPQPRRVLTSIEPHDHRHSGALGLVSTTSHLAGSC